MENGEGKAPTAGGTHDKDCVQVAVNIRPLITSELMLRCTDEQKRNLSPSMAALKSPSRRSDGGTGKNYAGEKRPTAKFSDALSKQEIEEDFGRRGKRKTWR